MRIRHCKSYKLNLARAAAMSKSKSPSTGNSLSWKAMNRVKFESMPSEPRGRNRVLRKCLSLGQCLLFISTFLTCSFAQESTQKEQSTLDGQSLSDRLAISTDSVEPIRFVAVHGRGAVIMGYLETGLEGWVYPSRSSAITKSAFGLREQRPSLMDAFNSG